MGKDSLLGNAPSLEQLLRENNHLPHSVGAQVPRTSLPQPAGMGHLCSPLNTSHLGGGSAAAQRPSCDTGAWLCVIPGLQDGRMPQIMEMLGLLGSSC